MRVGRLLWRKKVVIGITIWVCLIFSLFPLFSPSYPRLLILWVGYYLQSCPKLLYKGDYHPTYLLDPETYEWNALDKDLRKLLDESKYICPSERAREQSGEKQLMSDTKKDIAKDVGDFVSGMPGTLTDQQLEEFDIGSLKIKVLEVQAHAKVKVCSRPVQNVG